MARPVIEVEGISKCYRLGVIGATSLRETFSAWMGRLRRGGDSGAERDFWALRDISFTVQPGDVVGIIGRNGAGKSTLLKILSRITEPTAGRAVLRGRVASLLEVGTGFHPELTGRENIFLNGAILGMARAETRRKFDEIVAFAEVGAFIDTPVKRYSSGMYVRLAFAVAAHLDPEILIVDEVLAVGDAQFQKKCLGKMGDVRKDGTTILIVSHNIAVINNLCNRAVLLDAGRVEADGPAAEVSQRYLSGSQNSSGQAVWVDPSKAPGNERVRLHSVRILQEGTEGPTAEVDITREVLIEISYWNLKAGELLYAAIWLRDHQGTFVLASDSHRHVSLNDDAWQDRPHPAGLFRSVCTIPGNFLNEGLYSVSAIVGSGAADTQVLEDYAVSFHVHDSGEMRKAYYGEWLGTVRPKLAWSTEFEENSKPVR